VTGGQPPGWQPSLLDIADEGGAMDAEPLGRLAGAQPLVGHVESVGCDGQASYSLYRICAQCYGCDVQEGMGAGGLAYLK
jgi:hypothetical protein